MQIVSTVVSRPLDECWRVFTDPAALIAWIPGLRASLVIETRDDGLPQEIQFEFGKELIYSLLYTYDVAARIVRWEPRPGEHGAVRGFARFEKEGDGEATRVTYALEHEAGRKALDRAIDDPKLLVEAFARWMHEGPVA
ncbi:MAG: SRPBCC family protein [Deltaproteobacteria bacterium]|nr:SRPBCC family protein [Deltaproteobacteria bacterium]